MTGLFGSLNTATSGMNAQQNALQTTSHNLSNINTPGYSRQRVTMKTAFPQSRAGVGQMGMGVQISGITRVTDEYVTRQLENEMSSFVEQGNISEVLGQLEAIFNEPSESGVSSQMSDFFASWGSLGENPELDTNKKMVVSQSETFLDSINHIAKKMESLASDTIGQIKKDVLDFNSAAKQLKKVNEQIFNAKISGEEPNDLLDTQDQLIGELKTIADVEVKKDQYDRAMVSFGDDKVIVGSDELEEISVSIEGKIFYGEAAEDGYTDPANTVKIEMTQGSIKGFQDAHETVENKNKELNHFIGKFATTVNAIMNKNTSGENHNFFEIPTGGENLAKDIKINQSLLDDPSNLLVGKSAEGDADFAAGDGSRAKAISDLQNISIDFSKKVTGASASLEEELIAFKNYIEDDNQFENGSLTLKNDSTGSPVFDHYNEIITDMGIIKQQADNMMDNQADLVSLLSERKESISGVDMNEEVVNMIQQQSAFQANARMISTINEMLDTLINRTGV